ncbi:hypothetical protein MNBD_ALPHA06-761 [hydrothermal vent metagenome]|uniref:VTT domain-containing protein n=1 Tax=hydrothermal vent metagenome TaxID=652676 RepID=A0A3B0STQ4_9ZZZZ
MEQLLAAVQENHLGLATVILVFVVMGLVGTPQFVLIGASVLAFGPVMGSLYSWVATLFSAGVNFWLGRWIGAPPLARFGGARMAKISDYVSRNGLWSSMLMRVVPSGPFVLVNIAFGISKAKFGHFMLGTGVGILPKILAIAFLGQGLIAFVREQNVVVLLLFFALAGALTALIWFMGQAWKKRGER